MRKPSPSKMVPAKPPNKPNPVEAAVSIVKRAANHGVDWSREPQSEREAAIRSRILDKVLDIKLLPSFVIWVKARDAGLEFVRRDGWPRDLREAYQRAKAIEQAENDARKRREIENAAREIDGMPPLDDDEDDDED